MTDQTQKLEDEIQVIKEENPSQKEGENKEQKTTSKQFGLKLNKYFGLGCGLSIFWYSYKIYATNQERSNLKKQLVYSPSIIQQSNRKLNEYLNTLTSQIKDFLQLQNGNQNQENQQFYGKIKEKFENFEGGLQKTMKLIDESIQKYYRTDSVEEYEHIPITFVNVNNKTTVRINRVLVMGKIGYPEPEHDYLSTQDGLSDSLLYKRNFKEKLYLNNLLQSRQNPMFEVKEKFVNSFQLDDTQKDMKVIVKNFSNNTIITDDCFDYSYKEKDIMKLEKEVGILFACSLLLSPFPFYNGIQIGVQDSEVGIRARGIFCLLGDLVFDQQSQSFKMENPQFLSRSKQAIIEYLNKSIENYKQKLQYAMVGLGVSVILYYSLTHKDKIAYYYNQIKQKIKKSLLYLFHNIL